MKSKIYAAGMVVFFTMFLCPMGFSQNKIPVSDLSSEWKKVHTEKGIDFYAKKEIHTNEGPLNVDYVIIKLENTNSTEFSITYSLAVHTNLDCYGCGSKEHYKTILVDANSSVEGNLSKGRSPLADMIINHNAKNGEIAKFITLENLIIK